MRAAVFGARATVLTSATLKLGGDFTGVAGSLGLRAAERHDEPDWQPDTDENAAGSETDAGAPMPWRGLDVGSPFAYREQGIRYVARSLPPPGRDGMSDAVLAEIAAGWAQRSYPGAFSLLPRRPNRPVHVRRQLRS